MADTLNIYGVTYTGVTGIKATDSNNNVLTYVRASGTKTITENGTGIDVAQYQYADVNVSGGGSGSIVDVTDMPVFTVEFIDNLSDIDSVSCNMTYLECYDYVTGQMVDEGYAAVALLIDVNNDVTSYYGCYYHGASGSSLYFVVMDNTEPIGDLILDNSDTITFNSMSTALGIAGIPTATKGTVSNHSVPVTPSVTNIGGFISSGTKTGTAVTVSASELVSGTKSITANGQGIDVTNYESVNVNVPNSYSAADEGKVVDNGALVAQTAHADVTPTTSDQTIDTTTNNSIKVKGDADLVAANIKKDVEIFGVTGSYEGGGGDDTLYELLTNTLTGYESDQTAEIKYGTFWGCTSLTSASFPNMTGNVRNNAFFNCTNLETLNVRKATYIRGGAIRNTKLSNYVGTAACGFEDSSLAYNTSLQSIDIQGRPSGGTFEGGALRNNTSLKTLVIRQSAVAVLNNVNVFMSTPFASNGTGGTLYVPQAVISSYQSASNWSTILGYANNQIKSIESTHTDPTAPIDLTLYYADGTLIPT